ncbi:TlpA family protein disulfide reductase [Flavobacterium sp.]|jgi:peroxiredoxin|uniref:TlpA family protein disulfide reductase n=1 Tax=Flavobacterium sp. TaxID=239 RepID=UPI0037BEE872
MKKILLITLFLTSLNILSQEDYMKSSLVQLNETSPEFSFTTNDGKTVKLSDYKGKVILINFFATWCGPCMKEMPYIQKDLWEKLKKNDTFIILSFGRDHSQEEVNKFIETKKFTFPIFADKDKSIYNLFATKYIPRNYLIDSNGKVIYASTGFSEKEFEELKATIDKHLIK